MAAVRLSDSGVRAPSTGTPKFVMVGIDRPDGTVRLYASRDIPGAHWGMRDELTASGGIGEVAWHVDATMKNVLIIDKPTWGEAFARAFEIWANQDRAQAELEAEQQLRGHIGKMTGRLEAGRRAVSGKVLDGPAHPEGGRCEKHGEVGCAWCIPGPEAQ